MTRHSVAHPFPPPSVLYPVLYAQKYLHEKHTHAHSRTLYRWTSSNETFLCQYWTFRACLSERFTRIASSVTLTPAPPGETLVSPFPLIKSTAITHAPIRWRHRETTIISQNPPRFARTGYIIVSFHRRMLRPERTLAECICLVPSRNGSVLSRSHTAGHLAIPTSSAGLLHSPSSHCSGKHKTTTSPVFRRSQFFFHRQVCNSTRPYLLYWNRLMHTFLPFPPHMHSLREWQRHGEDGVKGPVY